MFRALLSREIRSSQGLRRNNVPLKLADAKMAPSSSRSMLTCWPPRRVRMVFLGLSAILLLASASVAASMSDSVARAAAKQYRGVHWHQGRRKFVAQLRVAGKLHYVGCFGSADQAARAFDNKLRKMCKSNLLRLKRSLNFPTSQESAYTESREQARARGLKTWGRASHKEAEAFKLLESYFRASPMSSFYEIRRLTGASKADALFMPNGFEEGLPIQLKAATSLGMQGKSYQFQSLSGYDGMLVIMIGLDGKHIWASAGQETSSKQLWITVGFESDTGRRVVDLGSHLVACFDDESAFPHVSMAEAMLQCADNHKLEVAAHLLFAQLISSADMCLGYPTVHQSAVDSLLAVADANGSMRHLRVQEKASRPRRADGLYHLNMWKAGGALGRLAYAEDDFDLLAAFLMGEDQLEGAFLIPTPALVEHGVVGKKAKSLHLYPPWCLPKRQSTKEKHSWQLDFFLDLRGWNGSQELEPELLERLRSLILQALDDASPSASLAV